MDALNEKVGKGTLARAYRKRTLLTPALREPKPALYD